jgi:hypothetical protein
MGNPVPAELMVSYKFPPKNILKIFSPKLFPFLSAKNLSRRIRITTMGLPLTDVAPSPA